MSTTLSVDEARERMRRNYPLFARNALKIQTKSSELIPFAFNPIQADYWLRLRDELLHGRGYIRDYVLKPRQLGFSTFILGLGYWDTIRREHVTTAIVAHEKDASKNLLDIVQRYYDHTPEWLRPRTRYRSRYEFYFHDIDGRIIVGTAANMNLGRSRTIHNLHASEYALWDDAGDSREIMRGLLQTIPSDGNIWIETTAKNFGSNAHQMWVGAKEGKNEWRPIFYAWFQHPAYQIAIDEHEQREIERTLDNHEIMLLETQGVTLPQLAWRRLKIREVNGDVETFDQEYPWNDTTCWLSSGRPFFDTTKIKDLLEQAQKEHPIEQADPVRAGGSLVYQRTIWKRPEPWRLYVIGADVAEGLESNDRSVAGVLDWETGEQVAKVEGYWEPHEFAKVLADLGAEYSGALIGVERNGHGHSVLNSLINWYQYPYIYHHEDYDQSGILTKRPGWPTNVKTRPVMLDSLRAMLHQGLMRVRDVDFLEECLGFVRNSSGKPEAARGMHDDRIMAWAIANMMREMRPPIVQVENIAIPYRIGDE